MYEAGEDARLAEALGIPIAGRTSKGLMTLMKERKEIYHNTATTNGDRNP